MTPTEQLRRVSRWSDEVLWKTHFAQAQLEAGWQLKGGSCPLTTTGIPNVVVEKTQNDVITTAKDRRMLRTNFSATKLGGHGGGNQRARC